MNGTFKASPNKAGELMSTPGKELLVEADPVLWWVKVITGTAYELVWFGLQNFQTFFSKRDWTGWTVDSHAFPDVWTAVTWHDVIVNGVPQSGSGDTRVFTESDGAGGSLTYMPYPHYFDTWSTDFTADFGGFTINSNTEGDNGPNGQADPGDGSGGTTHYVTSVTLSTSFDPSIVYNRAVQHMNNHNFSEFFWQDGLEVAERAYYSLGFANIDTTDAAAVAAASSIPAPWDFSEYNVHTDNGLTGDGPGQPGQPSASLAGWSDSSTYPTSGTLAGMLTLNAWKGRFKVDKPTYYFFFSQKFYDLPVGADGTRVVYFLKDGVAIPGQEYDAPGPLTTPYGAALPSQPAYSGRQVAEFVYVVFGISPESFAQTLTPGVWTVQR